MEAQPKKRLSVPGTRKREGAKNLPVTSFATWNVRTLNGDYHLEQLITEMSKFNIDMIGVSETHWTRETEEAFEHDNYVIIHSCRDDNIRRQGVAMVIEKTFASAMTSYDCYTERLMSVTFDTADGALTIFQIYAPDSSYTDETSEEFYDLLQVKINSLPSKNSYMLIGDFNAKVGKSDTEWPEVVGKYGLGERNNRGSHLLQFCVINQLIITNTMFRHPEKRKATWISPNGLVMNQIDFIITQEKWKSRIKNSRAYHSADIGSDHFLLLANINLVPKTPKRSKAVPRRFNVDKLVTDNGLAQTFEVKLGGAFEPLLALETDDIEVLYTKFKEVTNNITKETVGFRRRKHVEGLSPEIELTCDQRRRARVSLLENPSATREPFWSSKKAAIQDTQHCSQEGS